MFSFVVLFAVALTASVYSDSDMEKCMTILNAHCCKRHMFNKTTTDAEVKECMLIPRIPGSCDRSICFGVKKGFSTADGTIKMDEFKKHLEDKFIGHQDILEVVKKECLSGGFTSYGQPDDCDLSKMEYCIHWNYTFRCEDYSVDGPCEGFGEIAEDCLQLRSQ